MAERSRPLRHALLCAVLGLTVTGLVVTLVEQLGNTLHDNGRWRSSKVGLSRAVLGAVAFVTTRKALHRNRLDLGVWFGHQEVVYREPVELRELGFRMRLERGGYLVARFGRAEGSFAGVRLSADRARPSACLTGTSDGRFTSVRPLDAPPLDDRWHRVRAVTEEGGYRITLDGLPLGLCDALGPGPGFVGFRGGPYRRTLLDDVAIRTSSGEWIREDFGNRSNRGAVAAVSLLVVAVLAALPTALWRLRHGREHGAVTAWLPAEASLATGIVLLAMVWAVDTAVFWGRTIGGVDFRGYSSRIETQPQALARLSAAYPPGPPAPGVRRILFLGSSQTWGAGAARAEDVWIARLQRRWNAAAPPGERYELINAGISGLRAARVHELYESRWAAWEPEAIVVVLGHNDRDPDALTRELAALASTARRHGARTLFVPEPESPEKKYRHNPMSASHAAVLEAAARAGVPLLEVHDALAARAGEGFLWWDRVHLTSFGHALMVREVDRWRGAILAPRADDRDAAAGAAPPALAATRGAPNSGPAGSPSAGSRSSKPHGPAG
jgi:lysophospholipase L1-like esterase